MPGFEVGPHGRRNTRRTHPVERNVPFVARCIEAAHGRPRGRLRGGATAALRIAGDDQRAKYLMERLPRQMALLERERCHPAGRPACNGCPVRHLCEKWRAKQRQPAPAGPAIIDLFCGAGGMSLGFEKAGYVPVLAVDADLDAILTYRANRPWLAEDKVLARDIRELVAEGRFRKLRGRVEGVVGGPPCQTFSLVGYRTKKRRAAEGEADAEDHAGWRRDKIHGDDRTWLPTYMARIIAQVRPSFCVMENVAGYRSVLNGDVRSKTRATIARAGYTVIEVKVRAERLGAPQYRWRYMLIGIRNDVVHGRRRAEELLASVKARLEEGTGEEISAATALAALSRFGTVGPGGGREYTAAGGAETWNHYARKHNSRDRGIYKLLRPGETAAELEARRPGIIPYGLDSFGDKYRKLDLAKPSPTIPAHLKKDANSFIVPGADRGLTPREAATLQGFPADFVFVGEQSHQFQQIGNAVPPPVAEAVANLIREAIAQGQDTTWRPVLLGARGRRPSLETAVVREHLARLAGTGAHPRLAEVLRWASKRLRKSKESLRPMIYREQRRASLRSRNQKARAETGASSK